MDPDLDSTYAPKSPDLSADEPEQQPHPQHQQYRGSISHVSPFVTPTDVKATFNFPQPSPVAAHQPFPNSPVAFFGAPPGHNAPYIAMKQEPDEDEEDQYSNKAKAPPRKRIKAEQADMNGRGPAFAEGIDVRTKFPVARIKRIMQADEDVGKVAQVTPVAVCKSLIPSM
jgi:hypothetical protein